MSINVMPSSTTRRSKRIAAARSGGGPQMPGPVIRMAPKPSRLTVRSPSRRVPNVASFAGNRARMRGCHRCTFSWNSGEQITGIRPILAPGSLLQHADITDGDFPANASLARTYAVDAMSAAWATEPSCEGHQLRCRIAMHDGVATGAAARIERGPSSQVIATDWTRQLRSLVPHQRPVRVLTLRRAQGPGGQDA